MTDRPTFVRHGSTPVFYEDDLPPQQGSYGYSIHRGVLVVWDEDNDPRVLTLIDQMNPGAREALLAVGESQGSVSFLLEGQRSRPLPRRR